MRKSNAEFLAEAMDVSISPDQNYSQPSSSEYGADEMNDLGLIPIEPDDVKHHTIVLMGLTGSGKSSFISLLTGRDIGIGHDLQSCTSRSNEYSFKLDAGRIVHLIDTPGFNDTSTKDSDILKEIAFFLNRMHSENVDLNGVIFLHRITDQRMSGAALRNLRILQKLCGESSYPHVSLVTAMWGLLEDEATGVTREQGLMENANFWAPMKNKGSIISRHRGTVESARAIVEALIARGTTVLDVQRQMVDQQLGLDETTVGQFLQAELIEARKKHEKELEELEQALQEATEDNDPQLIKILTEQRQAQVKLLSQTTAEQQDLHVSSKNLDVERSQYLSELKSHVTQDEQRREDEIAALRKQIEFLKDDLVDTEIGRNRDITKALKDRENLIVHNKRLEHNAMVQQQNSEHQRRALMTQLVLKEQELQVQKRGQASGSGISRFFRSMFIYEEDDEEYDERLAYGGSTPGYRGRNHGHHHHHERPRERQRLSERSFRSNQLVVERRRNT